MPDTQAIHFTKDDRALLDALLDVILPASSDGALPAAGAFGVRAFIEARTADTEGFAGVVTRVLSSIRERLDATVAATLTDLGKPDRVALVQAVEAADPFSFVTFVFQVYMGYYTAPETRARLGMPERPPQPLGHQLPEDDDLETLLSPVRGRGKHYLDC